MVMKRLGSQFAVGRAVGSVGFLQRPEICKADAFHVTMGG